MFNSDGMPYDWIEIGWLAIGFLFGVTVLKSAGPIAIPFRAQGSLLDPARRKGSPSSFVYSESSTGERNRTRILPRIEPTPSS